MKNPFKKSSAPIEQNPKECLSDIQFIAQMQRKIDLTDSALARIVGYLLDPNFGNIDNEPCEAYVQERRQLYHIVFDFLRWLIKNRKDVLTDFRKYYCGNKD